MISRGEMAFLVFVIVAFTGFGISLAAMAGRSRRITAERKKHRAF